MNIDFTAVGGAPWLIYIDGVQQYDDAGKPLSYAAEHNALEKLEELKPLHPNQIVTARQINEIRADLVTADSFTGPASFTIEPSDPALVKVSGGPITVEPVGKGDVTLGLKRLP